MGFLNFFKKIGKKIGGGFKSIGKTIGSGFHKVTHFVDHKIIRPIYKKVVKPVGNKIINYVDRGVQRVERIADAGAKSAEGFGGFVSNPFGIVAIGIGGLVALNMIK